jgi:hypothetical protein
VSYLTLGGDGIEEHYVNRDGRYCVRPVESIDLKCNRCGWRPKAVKDSGKPHPEKCVCGGDLVAQLLKGKRP